MGTENLKEKITGLLENEAFKAELKNAESKDDLQKTFAKFGVDLTREEVDALASQIEMSLSNDELPIEQLEQVAGGGLLGDLWGIAKDVWGGCWKKGKQFANWEDGKR